MKKTVITIYILCSLMISNVFGQDIHFSQFNQSAIINNPSLTGIFNGDYKVGVLYRSQWSSIAVPYKTTLVNAEIKVRVNNVNDYISFGVLGYSDKAGTVDMKTVGVYPAINYNKSLDDKYGSYLSFGFAAGYIDRSLDLTKMTFDYQYQNGAFNAGNYNGETQTPNPKLHNWDLGAGITFNSSLDEDNKINYYVGAAAYHFTGMRTSFYSGIDAYKMSIKWTGSAGINWNIDQDYSFMLIANAVEQSPYQEIVGGGMLKWSKVDRDNHQPFSLSLGLLYRYQDAYIPTLQVDYKGNMLSLCYDINTSSLKTFTNMRGGFEIAVFRSGFFSKNYEDKHLCPRF